MHLKLSDRAFAIQNYDYNKFFFLKNSPHKARHKVQLFLHKYIITNQDFTVLQILLANYNSFKVIRIRPIFSGR